MEEQVGQIFTPLKWAEWLINKWNIFEAWVDGAHVCDPTAGQGAFALAMLQVARKNGVDITPERLSRLSLIEMLPSNLRHFQRDVRQKFGINFPDCQIFHQDIITQKHERKYDILIGNPPWINFVDLPTTYKTHIKPYFIREGLVEDKQGLLLGASRVDMAALVLKVVLRKLLKQNGLGYFYLPTSLFFGESAHKGFRNYHTDRRNFAIGAVYEFTSTKVFEDVSTSYCCARFQSDIQQEFPVTYYKECEGNWVEHKAFPFNKPNDSWRIVQNFDELKVCDTIEIRLTSEQKPRQGVNTCGMNSVYIFEEKPSHLPEEFLFPLATKELWRQNMSSTHKWILLPYHQESGKPLTWEHIQKYDTLCSYLQNFKVVLQKRNGTLLRASINKGQWWAMLGVGSYSFAPFKVMWEAYGRNHFKPIVLSHVDGQMWQGNQAMHAFIPCWSEEDAYRIKTSLENPEILKLLQQLNGAGKCNWAQPGKIKKILSLS